MQVRKRSKNSMRTDGKTKGFSLIELLIVMAVIMIVAAIAIPNFIKSRMSANESSAVQSLRNISTAQVVYSTMYGVGFAANMTSLSGNGVVVDQTQAGLIDQVLAAGTKSGFDFVYTPLLVDSSGHVQTYTVTADPHVVGSTGNRHFYTDQTCVIRVNTTTTAGPTDPPIS